MNVLLLYLLSENSSKYISILLDKNKYGDAQRIELKRHSKC